MTEFSNSDPLGRLEDELRAGRPSLSPDLEQSLVSGIGPARRRSGRTVTALILTTGVVGVFTAFGGVGYAFSGHSGSNGFSGSGSHNCYGGNHHQNHHHDKGGKHHHHHNKW